MAGPEVLIASSDDRSAALALGKMTAVAGRAIHPVFEIYQPDAIEFHAGIFAAGAQAHNQRVCIASGRICLEEGRGLIKVVAVDAESQITGESLRGKGLGSAIIAALEKVASMRGISDVVAVEPWTDESVRFFQKQGYVASKVRTDGHISEMSKTLAGVAPRLGVSHDQAPLSEY